MNVTLLGIMDSFCPLDIPQHRRSYRPPENPLQKVFQVVIIFKLSLVKKIWNLEGIPRKTICTKLVVFWPRYTPLRYATRLFRLIDRQKASPSSFAAPLLMIWRENLRKSQLKNKSATVSQFLLVHLCNCRWHTFMFHRLCINKSLQTLPLQSLPSRFLVSLIITDRTINTAFR